MNQLPRRRGRPAPGRDSAEGWKTAVHARGAAYYQVFSGAGHTYGNGAVHQLREPGIDAPYEVRAPVAGGQSTTRAARG